MFSRQFVRLASRTLTKGGKRLFSSQTALKTGKSPFLALALSGIAVSSAVMVRYTFNRLISGGIISNVIILLIVA